MPEGPMDERDLDRFLNDLVTGRPAAGGYDLAPDLREAIRLVRALGAAPLPAPSRERVGQAVRAEIERLATAKPEGAPHGPHDHAARAGQRHGVGIGSPSTAWNSSTSSREPGSRFC